MKQNKIYKVKTLQGQKVSDIDPASRRVSGYLSSFNVKDSDNDVILPGAFKQSISMRGPHSETNRKIAFLKMHDWNMQIGKFDELEEDDYGLKFVATLGRSRVAQDALVDYQDGILREHSIGFTYVENGIEYDEKTESYLIRELMLFEGSAVTFGANEFTPVLDVSKGLDITKTFSDISDELDSIVSALKSGKGSDERLYNLEMRLRVLQGKQAQLFEALRPSNVDTLTAKEESRTAANAVDNLDFLRLISI